MLARADVGGYDVPMRGSMSTKWSANAVRAVTVVAAAKGLRVTSEIQSDIALMETMDYCTG